MLAESIWEAGFAPRIGKGAGAIGGDTVAPGWPALESAAGLLPPGTPREDATSNPETKITGERCGSLLRANNVAGTIKFTL